MYENFKKERFRLREVTVSDALDIVKIRREPKNSRFIHETSASIEHQEKYIEDNLKKNDDYLFVVEKISSNEFFGTVSVYDIATNNYERTAEWGRFVLKEDLGVAAETCFLLYKFVFEHLFLDSVYCRTVEKNKSVVSFHDRVGLTRTGHLKNHFYEMTSIEHTLRKKDYKAVLATLDTYIDKVNKVLV